ncbi:MAG: hypothetical protein ACFFBR_11545 [Promethearchaeota archaeon]
MVVHSAPSCAVLSAPKRRELQTLTTGGSVRWGYWAKRADIEAEILIEEVGDAYGAGSRTRLISMNS